MTCPAAVYTGAAQSCTATTTPTGLTVDAMDNSIATAPTAPGTYPVVATISQAGYVGTGNATLTIAQAPTTTTLDSPPGSVNPGQSVTLTATVAPTAMGTTGPPTGTVNFYNGTTLLNPTPVALSAGTASYVVPAASLTVGTTYTIAVDYSGDTNFLASTTSSTTPVIVGRA